MPNIDYIPFCCVSVIHKFLFISKQPKLTAVIQSCRLTLFEHIMHIDDNTDAKRILLAFPSTDWRRQLGRPRITWLSSVQQDLKQHHLIRSPKQQVWLRTALCGGWCRRIALRNRKSCMPERRRRHTNKAMITDYYYFSLSIGMSKTNP